MGENDTHKHKLVYLGRLKVEFGGDYPLYQCGDCGATFEQFSGVKYAVFYPTMTAHIATFKEEIEFVRNRPRSRAPKEKVLGRGLVELGTRKQTELKADKGLGLLLGVKK